MKRDVDKRVLVEFGPMRNEFEQHSFRYEPGQLCEVVGIDAQDPRKLVVTIDREAGYREKMSVPERHVQFIH